MPTLFKLHIVFCRNFTSADDKGKELLSSCQNQCPKQVIPNECVLHCCKNNVLCLLFTHICLCLCSWVVVIAVSCCVTRVSVSRSAVKGWSSDAHVRELKRYKLTPMFADPTAMCVFVYPRFCTETHTCLILMAPLHNVKQKKNIFQRSHVHCVYMNLQTWE